MSILFFTIVTKIKFIVVSMYIHIKNYGKKNLILLIPGNEENKCFFLLVNIAFNSLHYSKMSFYVSSQNIILNKFL